MPSSTPSVVLADSGQPTPPLWAGRASTRYDQETLRLMRSRQMFKHYWREAKPRSRHRIIIELELCRLTNELLKRKRPKVSVPAKIVRH